MGVPGVHMNPLGMEGAKIFSKFASISVVHPLILVTRARPSACMSGETCFKKDFPAIAAPLIEVVQTTLKEDHKTNAELARVIKT